MPVTDTTTVGSSLRMIARLTNPNARIRRTLLWAPLALALGLHVCACGSSQPVEADARGAMQPATVDYVVDGDTLDVWLHGTKVRVRTLQIDAPESSTLRFGHADRCGAPAKEYAEKLVYPGEHVTLELAGSEHHDKYGRLLALVHLGGPQAITWQQLMARSGWAEVFVYGSNRTWLLPTLTADQAYAMRHHLGVYAICKGEFHEGDGGAG